MVVTEVAGLRPLVVLQQLSQAVGLQQVSTKASFVSTPKTYFSTDRAIRQVYYQNKNPPCIIIYLNSIY